MDILIIGGGSFIGFHLAEKALAAGHRVTTFNRGLTDPEARPGVDRLTGDREKPEDLAQLGTRDWDAVFDTCGYEDRVVRMSADVLRGKVGYYAYISSIAVYADFKAPRKEDDPLIDPYPQAVTERLIGGSPMYGPMKVRCEKIIRETFPDGWLAVRLTSGTGPRDLGASNRRTAYWGQRVRDYDEILVPGPADRPVAYIDVRDMAHWIVRMAEQRQSGAFNAAAPAFTIAGYLEKVREHYGTSTRFVFADPDWLLAQGVKPNVELPWWTPGEDRRYNTAVDGSKAIAAGLRIRPFAETLDASVAWEDSRPPQKLVPGSAFSGQARGTGLSRERELELLARWKAREGVDA